MPFKVLVGYFPSAHGDETPRFLYILWVLGGAATAATFYNVISHLVREAEGQTRLMREEDRVTTSYHARLVRVIVVCPLPMCLIAYVTLFVPASAYCVDFSIVIVAVLAVGHIAHDFVHALGEPPETREIAKRFPKRRWFCGSCCGGAFEPLCCVGLCMRKEFKLGLEHVRMAMKLVAFWTWILVFTACVKFTANSYAIETVTLDQDGWCGAQGAWMNFRSILDLSGILWCLPGLSGLTMLASAASLATGEQYGAKDSVFNAKAKNDAGGTYLGLALYRVLLDWIAGFLVQRKPTVNWYFPTPGAIRIPGATLFNMTVRHKSAVVFHGVFSEVECAIYDKQVVSMYLYCTLITVFMALLSHGNSKLYPPAEDTAKLLRQRERELRLERGDCPGSTGDPDESDMFSETSSENDAEDQRTPAHSLR